MPTIDIIAGILQQQGGGGGAGVSYVGTGTTSSADATDTLALAVDPPGVSNGDLLIAVVHINDDSPVIVGPAGWTELQQAGGAVGQDNRAGVWWRLRDGTEGATENWTAATGSLSWVGVVIAYTGVDQATPVVDTSANDYRTSDGAATQTPPSYAGSLPTVAEGDGLLFYTAARSGATTAAPPAGTTDRGEFNNGGTIWLADQVGISSAPAAADWEFTGAASIAYWIGGPVLMKAA